MKDEIPSLEDCVKQIKETGSNSAYRTRLQFLTLSVNESFDPAQEAKGFIAEMEKQELAANLCPCEYCGEPTPAHIRLGCRGCTNMICEKCCIFVTDKNPNDKTYNFARTGDFPMFALEAPNGKFYGNGFCGWDCYCQDCIDLL